MLTNRQSSSAISRRTAIGGVMATLLAVGSPGFGRAEATPAPTGGPNTYRLSGEDIEIVYASTSFDGQPTLEYRTSEIEMTFRGSQIEIESRSTLGQLVSVKVESVEDAYSVWVTLLLPQINLSDRFDDPTHFSTLAIQSRHRSHVGGPGMVEGTLTSYTATALEGTAELLYY